MLRVSGEQGVVNVSPPPVRVVFLDIDGVLQPTDSQKPFDHDLVADRTCEPHGPYRHLSG